MGLEQEINQYHFRSDRQKTMINLIYSYNWITEKMKHVLDEYELTMQQFNILRILRGANAPLSTMQIRERMLDKMSDTSRIVDRLILKDLVMKHTCPRDKRLVDVMITEKGLVLLSRLDAHQEEIDAVVGNLSAEELCQLNTLLDKIRCTGNSTTGEEHITAHKLEN